MFKKLFSLFTALFVATAPAQLPRVMRVDGAWCSGFQIHQGGRFATAAHCLAEEGLLDSIHPDQKVQVLDYRPDKDILVYAAGNNNGEYETVKLASNRVAANEEVSTEGWALYGPLGLVPIRAKFWGKVMYQDKGNYFLVPNADPNSQRIYMDLQGGPGMSGSPVYNKKGEVVGMLVGGFEVPGHFALAVPLEDLREVLSKWLPQS